MTVDRSPQPPGPQAFFASGKAPPVGCWFALVGDKVVATSDSAKEAFEEAKRKYPDEEIFIAKFPKNKVMVL